MPTALVTGASSGVGAAVATRLVADGRGPVVPVAAPSRAIVATVDLSPHLVGRGAAARRSNRGRR